MDKKRVLGRGLAALIPDDLKNSLDKNATGFGESSREAVIKISPAQIVGSRYQPRTEFNDEKLQELIASIKEKGFLQPVLVRKHEKGYELIVGERRLRAAKALNLKEIPAMVKSVKDEDALVISIIENVQREELNAIEEAHAFQRLISEFNFSQDVVAQSVGKDRTSISNTLRLLKLPKEIQGYVSQGLLSMGHARALLSLIDSKKQIRLSKKIINKGLSVRETENLIKGFSGQTKREHPGTEKRSIDLIGAEEKLQNLLGTKVRITQFKKRGKIVIDYYSKEDLSRLIEVIEK